MNYNKLRLFALTAFGQSAILNLKDEWRIVASWISPILSRIPVNRRACAEESGERRSSNVKNARRKISLAFFGARLPIATATAL
jgi:hypothetical protein